MSSTYDRPHQSMEFGSLQISYDDQVLTPRTWTAWQSLWAAELAAALPAGRILELCAGAGQIGLLAAARSDRDLVAVDRDRTACQFAEQNARTAGLAGQVEVRNLPLESACASGELFPLVIADPPWVPASETIRFPADPLSAIDGGQDGLDVARACLVVIDDHLAPGGAALLQVGTIDQVDTLLAELPRGLRVTDVRAEEGRGVVALIERSTAA